jgi:hypothetical protein
MELEGHEKLNDLVEAILAFFGILSANFIQLMLP